MRADRLVATLLFLQSRGRVTAAELATELEVSVKTARRDLEALAVSGIPVYPQTGRNGGWQLLGGARTDLSGLTADEARTLFMVAGPASRATPDAKAALRKLVRALPETFRDQAERAASATVLDAAHWGTVEVAHPVFLDALRRAVVAGRCIELGYSDRQRSLTTRTAHPLGVVEKGSTWYLICDTDKGLRTFRVNRVRSVTVLDQPVVRPEGFDLAEAWRSIAAEVEKQRTTVQAVVRVARRSVPGLRMVFGPTTRVIGEAEGEAVAPVRIDADDQVDVLVGAPSEWGIAQRLAPWGEYVEVIEPPGVRDQLVAIGKALIAKHSRVEEATEGVRHLP